MTAKNNPGTHIYICPSKHAKGRARKEGGNIMHPACGALETQEEAGCCCILNINEKMAPMTKKQDTERHTGRSAPRAPAR